MSNLDDILELAKQELVRDSGTLDSARSLRHMHIYLVRGLWRWFTSTPEADDEWMAHTHMKMAVLMLETARGLAGKPCSNQSPSSVPKS